MERLTVSEAAERLGISKDAVRKRTHRGTLAHGKWPDGRVYIYLDVVESAKKTRGGGKYHSMDNKIPPPPKEYSSDLYRELFAELRTLRDTELKMLPMFFTSMAFVLAANVALFGSASASPNLMLWVGSISILFVVMFAWGLIRRLGHDNRAYRELGARVTVIRRFWGVLPSEEEPNRITFFDRSAEKFGQGRGYRRNQWVVAFTAATIVLILVGGCFIESGLGNGN
jgi:excisionase family DNA binding protein